MPCLPPGYAGRKEEPGGEVWARSHSREIKAWEWVPKNLEGDDPRWLALQGNRNKWWRQFWRPVSDYQPVLMRRRDGRQRYHRTCEVLSSNVSARRSHSCGCATKAMHACRVSAITELRRPASPGKEPKLCDLGVTRRKHIVRDSEGPLWHGRPCIISGRSHGAHYAGRPWNPSAREPCVLVHSPSRRA
jgi:hypothetical protein